LNHTSRTTLLLFGIFAYLSLTNVSSETETSESSKSARTIQKPINIEAFVNSQIGKGKLAYRKKDYNLAIEEWKKVLEVDPKNEEARRLLSSAQEKLQEISPKDDKIVSVPAYKKEAFVQNQIDIAKRAYRKADYETAYAALKTGLQVDPRNREMKQLMGSLLEKQPSLEQPPVPQKEELPITPEPTEPTPPPQPKTQAEKAPQEISGEQDEYFEPEKSSKDYKTFEKLPLDGIPLTLEQCIMIARANSLSVKIAREEAALARWKVAPARRALYPSFDVLWKETRGTTTGQDFEGREITLEFQKPLITWGKTKALYLQAQVNWEIAKRNLQKEVTELDFKVEQAYFILANALKDTQDLHALYKDADKDVKMAEQRYKLELARELEFMKVKSKVDEIYYRVQSAEKDLILAHLTLAQILDSRHENPYIVKARLGSYEVETSLEQCIELALKNRSDLIVNELLIEYNRLGQKVARSEYKWNVNLEGSVGVNDEAFISEELDLQDEYFIGVKVTKPFGPHTFEDNFLTQDKVPSVGQTTSTEFTSNTVKWYFWNSTAKINIKEADIKYLKAIDEYIKKRNSIIFEVKKNYYEYLKAKQQLNNNRQKIKVSEEELKISVARLGLNEILDSELLESKDRLSRTKSEYGQALTGYYTAVANLNKSIGLTDYFDLKRGIKEQAADDPEAWRKFINEPGDIGSLPNTEGYKEVIERLEGKKKSWWQGWGGSSAAAVKEPRTTQELVEKTTDEGVMLYKQGKYEEALNKFEAALALEPDHLKAQSYSRKTKIKLGKEVEEPVKKSNFSAKGLDADDWFDKGLEAYKKKNYEEAITAWNKTLELDPTNRRAQVYLQRAKSKIPKPE
jgi:outer membrane protein TolC/Flp pilus assembly protein TadD